MSNTFQYDSPLVYRSSQQYDPYVPPVISVAPTVIPHLAVPVTLNADGSFAWLVQDSIQEIAQSVEVIVGSHPGERTVNPTFGTMIIFLSESFPHEVLISHATRRSIAGWFRVSGS